MLRRIAIGFGLIIILMMCSIMLNAQVAPAQDEGASQEDTQSSPNISVVLEEDDELLVDAKGICTIPIKAVQRLELGSISLVIDFPDEVLEVQDVVSKIKGKMIYSIADGVIRISWYSMIPIKINPGDELIRLKCRNTHLNPLSNAKKRKPGSKVSNNDISLRIRPISMVSNGRSVDMSNVVLTYPKLTTK